MRPCGILAFGRLNYGYLFTMNIAVSNGDLLDRLSILEIKIQRVTEPQKIENIRRYYGQLLQVADPIKSAAGALYEDLHRINGLLWDMENSIRELESRQQFDNEFITAARSVYKYNDERARIKQQIDILTGSAIREEKSYSEY